MIVLFQRIGCANHRQIKNLATASARDEIGGRTITVEGNDRQGLESAREPDEHREHAIGIGFDNRAIRNFVGQ